MGILPPVARRRAVSLGLAGVSHAAACAGASGALAMPLQAEPSPGVSRTPLGMGRCCCIFTSLSPAEQAQLSACALAPTHHCQGVPRLALLCRSFGAPNWSQYPDMAPQCGAEGYAPPLPVTCHPPCVKLKNRMMPPDCLQVTSFADPEKPVWSETA